MKLTERDLTDIRKALTARERIGKTHWEGCHLDPTHRDCLAWRLLEAAEGLRQRLEAKAAEWRHEAAVIVAALGPQDDRTDVLQAARLECCAEQLERLLEGRL